MFNHETIKRALALADKTHAGVQRKYSGEPYVEHPKTVARIVVDTYKEFHEEAPVEIVAAALLHDVLEDTDTPIDEIVSVGQDEKEGRTILRLVLALTDMKALKGSRKWRKEASLIRLAEAGPEVALVKLADRLHNAGDMAATNPEFFRKKYAAESIRLVDVLEKANPIYISRLSFLGDQIRAIVE